MADPNLQVETVPISVEQLRWSRPTC